MKNLIVLSNFLGKQGFEVTNITNLEDSEILKEAENNTLLGEFIWDSFVHHSKLKVDIKRIECEVLEAGKIFNNSQQWMFCLILSGLGRKTNTYKLYMKEVLSRETKTFEVEI